MPHHPYFQAIHRQSPGGEAGQHQKPENITPEAGEHHIFSRRLRLSTVFPSTLA
jgi:hypothetical protein